MIHVPDHYLPHNINRSIDKRLHLCSRHYPEKSNNSPNTLGWALYRSRRASNTAAELALKIVGRRRVQE